MWIHNVDTRRSRYKKRNNWGIPRRRVDTAYKWIIIIIRSFVRSFARTIQSRGTSLRVNTIMYNLRLFFVDYSSCSPYLRSVTSFIWSLTLQWQPRRVNKRARGREKRNRSTVSRQIKRWTKFYLHIKHLPSSFLLPSFLPISLSHPLPLSFLSKRRVFFVV